MTESRSREVVLPLDDLEHDAEVAINHLVDRGNQCLSIGKHEDAERNQNGGDALDDLGRRQRNLSGPVKALRNSVCCGAEVGVLGHGVCPCGRWIRYGSGCPDPYRGVMRLAWPSGSWSVFHLRRSGAEG